MIRKGSNNDTITVNY